MSAPIITDLDLASWMREASRQTDPVGYLDGLNRSATIAVAAGDEYVTIVSGDKTWPYATNRQPRRSATQ